MAISSKQKQILAFPYTKYDALVADGAIRSGKTSFMIVAFIDDAMRRYNNQRFGICGKTVDSATKNIVVPYLSLTYAQKKYILKWHGKDKVLSVSNGKHTNHFEIFGGKDESSFQLIQGRTLAGVLIDEVALQPRSFVEQALARCSVAGSKLWFNCNPASPQHWFYKEWIKKASEHNAYHIHFRLQDNPALDEKIIHRYETMYTGVFYDRYIKGLWVSADGLIYDQFSTSRHVVSDVETEGDYYVSSDYGIQNATVFLLWRKKKDSDAYVCLKEYYYSGRDNRKQKTVTELVDGLKDALGDIEPREIIVDPSASALIVELKKQGYHTRHAKNDVLDGIADVSTMLASDRLLFHSSCENTIEEFGSYAWDETAANRGEDKPIKEHDHSMDAVRYFVRTRRLTRRGSDEDKKSIFM